LNGDRSGGGANAATLDQSDICRRSGKLDRFLSDTPERYVTLGWLQQQQQQSGGR